jgi:hypothetical protein
MSVKRAAGALLVLCACSGGGADSVRARADSVAVDSAVDFLPAETGLSPIVVDSARKFRPVDESAQDTSFARFRSSLLDAVQRRDTTFLYSVLAAEIKNSFGGDDSISGFRRLWKPDSPDSRVWDVIARLFQLGATREGEAFVAPYVYSKWPQDLDAFENAAIVSERAIVRALPNDTAQALGTLSYEIVPAREWVGLEENGAHGPHTWAHVRLGAARLGWVKGADVYSPVGYRAFFEKRNGAWKMVILVAGD